MSIKLTCDSCNKTMKVSDALAGKRRRCPFCKNKINVPSVGSGPTKRSAAAPSKSKRPAQATVTSSATALLPSSPPASTPAPPPSDPGETVVPCGQCGNELLNDAEIAGQIVECPHCGAHLQMPPLTRQSSYQPGPLVVNTTPGPAREVICPFCSETINAGAKRCKHCGETLDPVLRMTEEAERAAKQANKKAAHDDFEAAEENNPAQAKKVDDDFEVVEG